MNTIIVKTHNANSTVDQVQVITKDGQPTVIAAADKVNYEFHDTAIGRAPNHIVTKRIKNDLHVSFEEDGQDSDLIIEGFYDSSDSALLGIAEDGEYYYYIPDTGETYDYVTQLAIGDTEGQALGGAQYVAAAGLPWWIPAAAGLGLIGLVAGSSRGKDNDDNDNTPVETAPVATNDSVTTLPGAPVTTNIITNDTDANNDPLTVKNFTVGGETYLPGNDATIPNVGTITVGTDGSLTFTPVPGYVGSVPPVDYTVTDSKGGEDTGTVTFTDVPNTPPVATNDSVTTLPGAPVTTNIITNDTDANNDPLTVKNFTVGGETYLPGNDATIPNVGTITVGTDGNLIFTPETNYAGPVPPVDYTVTDGKGGKDTGTVTFTDVPNAPVAEDDTAIGETGKSVIVDVVNNDNDDDGDLDPTTVRLIDPDTGNKVTNIEVTGEGTWKVDPVTGEVTFTPQSGFIGDPTPVEYVVSDKNGLESNQATIKVDYPPAIDDTVSMQEDSGTISGNVLTNDQLGLTVTGIQIGGTNYAVGTATVIAGVGTIQIDSNGEYSFTPVLDYSGEVPTITYTVSDSITTDTADLNIEVIAVADKPTAGNFAFDPPDLSLNIQTWSNVKNVNGQNLLANKGNGASEEILLSSIDYLRANLGSTVNNTGPDNTVINNTGSGLTTSLADATLPTFDAVYISGYVFLETGQTYEYSGSGDDSAAIVIGDDVSSLHVNWKGTSTSGNGEFSVTQSGFYSFQFYAHNAEGVGNYNFAVENSDGSVMKYYPNLTAIQDSLDNTSYILGDYDAGADGSNDTGFYPVNIGYQGASTATISLTGIVLETTDTDGSEYLSFNMSGLPAGAALSFKDGDSVAQSITVDANGIASYIPTDKDAGTALYTDFTLTVNSIADSLLDVSLTVTSTEKSNGDSSSSTLDFEVKVTDATGPRPFSNDDSLSMDDGTGVDTLVINTNIDFSNFDSTVYAGFEVIDMTGNGEQSLTNLSTSDVLDIINDTVMFDKGLIINGDNEDSVSLLGWNNSTSTVEQGGIDYNVYSFADNIGTPNLLIQDDIAVTII
ncbi:Ig-like domain-containing protein [Psychrobacter sp. DAB_AL43B]|uniref:Ig-like domain-containing protein n=1 Tax=Psychrobacter sp. DAB_AL43B TaxID=1028416 RepID=UPI0009A81361|nr:Ig-like domain-containing protein [Psychrobacter sp. DAB_AL43B]SLJ84761.1 hypothetical protein DABAL43B_1566 [Psychrobacter sp. DAB_AL43B]